MDLRLNGFNICLCNATIHGAAHDTLNGPFLHQKTCTKKAVGKLVFTLESPVSSLERHGRFWYELEPFFYPRRKSCYQICNDCMAPNVFFALRKLESMLISLGRCQRFQKKGTITIRWKGDTNSMAIRVMRHLLGYSYNLYAGFEDQLKTLNVLKNWNDLYN